MKFVDSHAHLSDAALLPHIEAIVARARLAHVERILNICTTPEELVAGWELEQRFPEIQCAGATTPHDCEKESGATFAFFARAAKEGKLAAVGEVGLDYHYKELPKEVQKRVLERYLQLSGETKLPVIFHCREAFADLFAMTDALYPKGAPAILHCFTGTMEEAMGVWERGWYLSLSGIVTFKNSQALREVAREAPLSQLLIETDAPFLAPQSKRGKQNEPAFLPEVASCIAAVKGVRVEEVARATADNAKALFHFKD